LKNVVLIVIGVIALLVGFRWYTQMAAEKEAFDKHEALVKETNECIEMAEWNCAEKNIRTLLKETPDDQNLQLHLAWILHEQERYEECIAYVQSRKFSHDDLTYLRQKSELLIHEMETLGLERSMHFRVEFEGRPAPSDVMEALSVLEVAYDSLCHLFDYHPENKMHLVLYESSQYQGVGPRPEWVGAIFDGKLRIPVNVMNYREIYRPMFFHELTHAFVRAMTRYHVPLWVNEGIAQVIDASRTGMAKPEGSVPSIESLSTPFVNENSTGTAIKLYWYSQAMVERLLARNASLVHFRDFIQSLRTLGSDEALKKYYGVTAQQLLDEVR
jgi:hypothetical protein